MKTKTNPNGHHPVAVWVRFGFQLDSLEKNDPPRAENRVYSGCLMAHFPKFHLILSNKMKYTRCIMFNTSGFCSLTTVPPPSPSPSPHIVKFNVFSFIMKINATRSSLNQLSHPMSNSSVYIYLQNERK